MWRLEEQNTRNPMDTGVWWKFCVTAEDELLYALMELEKFLRDQ